MALSVFVIPLSVLFVRVCEPASVTTVSAPTVAEVMLNAPPVTVLPVKVNAVGRDSVMAVVPVEAISLAVPATLTTAPMDAGEMATLPAKESCPCALTVNRPTCVAEPYVAGVTAVFASEIVPEAVIGPPVRPVPVSIRVTATPATIEPQPELV